MGWGTKYGEAGGNSQLRVVECTRNGIKWYDKLWLLFSVTTLEIDLKHLLYEESWYSSS